MNIQISATASCTERQEALQERARRLASRKVLRFLDPASLAPFVAAVALYRDSPVAAPEDVSLYTMSGWDGDMPDWPVASDGTRDSDALISRHILENANPLGWLRLMSNNALCQASIAEGFRGPNAHLVGGPEALAQALAVAAGDLRRKDARQALVVAYDTAPENRNSPSDRAWTSAAALSLVPAAAGEDVLPELSALARSAAESSGSALEVMRTCIGALTVPRAEAGSR